MSSYLDGAMDDEMDMHLKRQKNKKRHSIDRDGMPGCGFQRKNLDDGDVYSRWPFGALLYLKTHLIAFLKTFKACPIDTGVMNEHVRSVLLFNKSIPFSLIKPLYCSICHRWHPPLKKS